MPPLASALAEFAVCAALIGFAGTRLVRHGDVIGAKTGLTGSWVGMVLIGVVTSLPELITGVSAVALAGTPDIAVGNALGACIVNMLLFVLLDLLHRKESIYGVASRGHTLAAAFGGVGFAVVGSALVSIATTIPEAVVTLAALRIGAVDVAIGNLLGSNLFNVAIIAVDDIAYPHGALLEHAAPGHALSAFAAILMTCTVAAALVYRAPRGRTGAMTFANATLVAIYLLNGYAMFAGAR